MAVLQLFSLRHLKLLAQQSCSDIPLSDQLTRAGLVWSQV